MKKVLGYNTFINEKYMEDPEYRIRKFFEELEKNIKFWFDEGSFAANGAELMDINIETTNNIENIFKNGFS